MINQTIGVILLMNFMPWYGDCKVSSMTETSTAEPTDSLLMTLNDASEYVYARNSVVLPLSDISFINGSLCYITTDKNISSFLAKVLRRKKQVHT